MSTHTPRRQTLIWGLLVATLCWLGLMSFASRQFQKAECRASDWVTSAECALKAPGVDLQLAESPEQFQKVLVPDSAVAKENVKIMCINTYLDFGFIFLYGSLILLLAGEYQGRIGVFARGAISIAVLFDVLENSRLLRVFNSLDATGSVRTALPRPYSLTKWTAFAAALFLLGSVILKYAKNRTAQVVAWSLIASSACTIGGLFLGSPLITVALAILIVPLGVALVHYAPFHIPAEAIFLAIGLQSIYLKFRDLRHQ